MAKILRLEGLDRNASAEDIRSFFDYLYIPEGGVYIVGGKLGEAFIAFNTERQAQLATLRSGRLLKGSPVMLYTSSMDELELKLESVLNQKKKKMKKKTSLEPVDKPQPTTTLTCTNVQSLHDATSSISPSTAWPVDPHAANTPPLKSDIQIDISTAFVLGMCAVLQGQKSPNSILEVDAGQTNGGSTLTEEVESNGQKVNQEPGYVRLFGLPATITKQNICDFFHGLTVKEVIVNAKLEHKYACLVKFASMQEASDALRFNKQSLGTDWVEVRGATEKLWNSVLQECKNAEGNQDSLPQDSLVNGLNPEENSSQQVKRTTNQPHFNPTKKFKYGRDVATDSSTAVQHIIMVNNLPKTITKTDLKELFGCPDIPHKNVLHLLDQESNRTDTAFLIFHNIDDFNYAVNLNGCHVGGGCIEVSSITKEKMSEVMAKSHHRYLRSFSNKSKFGRMRDAPTWIFMRNLPADVQKSQVNDLFHKFKVNEDDVTLLCDKDGNGIGEAVVRFQSAKFAALAQRFQGKEFLGGKLFLTLITEDQKEDIILKHQTGGFHDT